MGDKIDIISSTIKYEIIEGIGIEINDFFSSLSNIKDFKFDKEKTIDTKIYHVNIRVNKFDIKIIKDIFLRFVRFLEYSHFTAYICNIDKEKHIVTYKLISATENNRGFYCNLSFLL